MTEIGTDFFGSPDVALGYGWQSRINFTTINCAYFLIYIDSSNAITISNCFIMKGYIFYYMLVINPLGMDRIFGILPIRPCFDIQY